MSEAIPGLASAESRMVSVPGGRLHVMDFPGDEPALVVMHGFPDDSRIYNRLAPLLTPRRVVAVDWLGYGRTIEGVDYRGHDRGTRVHHIGRCCLGTVLDIRLLFRSQDGRGHRANHGIEQGNLAGSPHF